MDTRSVKRNYCIQQWKSIIQDRNNSGMTVDAYCEQNGLSCDSYFYWLRIIREEYLNQKTSSGFVELSLQADAGSETSMVTTILIEKPVMSQLALSIKGITIQVTENTSSGQLFFDLDHPNVFNEAEVLTEAGFPGEPSIEEIVPVRKPRPKGKRAVDLAGIKTTTESHYLDEATLDDTFPKGWHQFEDEVYKELKRIPASYEVVEHHIGVYAGNGNDTKIIRGEVPGRLLNHSILTPSLAASVFTAKYVNAVPLNRISEGYGYDGIHISRQVMAGWMIKLHRENSNQIFIDNMNYFQYHNKCSRQKPAGECRSIPQLKLWQLKLDMNFQSAGLEVRTRQ